MDIRWKRATVIKDVKTRVEFEPYFGNHGDLQKMEIKFGQKLGITTHD